MHAIVEYLLIEKCNESKKFEIIRIIIIYYLIYQIENKVQII